MTCEHWCVMTKAHNGTVSLLKGLTETEAQEVSNRLCPHVEREPGSAYFIHKGDDYTRPLDVRWLCVVCHHRHHHPQTIRSHSQ